MDANLAGRLKGARIMVVEDDQASRMVMEHLARWQAVERCYTAPTVAKALEELPDLFVDIVFTDLHTPNGNGLDLVKAVRAGEAGYENMRCAIVAITGDARENVVAELAQAGVDGFLIKPISSGAFVSRAEHAWNRGKARGAERKSA